MFIVPPLQVPVADLPEQVQGPPEEEVIINQKGKLMKRTIFAFIAFVCTMAMEAQNISDAMRYSTSELNGTARYRAMSGAFGALGGDLSSLNVNPAGSAVFLSSIASLTLNIENTDNEVIYNNGFTTGSDSNIDLGQGGAAFVFNNSDEEADWKKFTVAFNYTKTASFEDDWLAAGDNTTSVSSYFLDYTQNIPIELLELQNNESISDLYSYLGETEGFAAQQAFLGYQGFLFDYDPDNTSSEYNPYTSNVAPGNFDQEYFYAASGLNGKFSFNVATQYQDFLYLGLNLNSHFINYERVTSISELNNNTGSSINEIYFEDRLSTLGNGFSFQLGGLAKIGEGLRAGLAYESPTWYNISEETTQYLETVSDAEGRAVVDPNVVNIYPEYKLQTPSVYTGSLAYLFGENALLSFDYSYKDYSTTKFRPKDDPAFAFQNSLMEEELKAASIYKIGGEYRVMGWSLRGGYRFEESPYVDGSTIGDLQGYSAGLGYSFGNIKIDVAYDRAQQEFNPRLYETGLTDRANIDKTLSNFILTVNFGI